MNISEEIEDFLKSGGEIQKIPDGIGKGFSPCRDPLNNKVHRDGEKSKGKGTPFPQLHNEVKPKRYGRI